MDLSSLFSHALKQANMLHFMWTSVQISSIVSYAEISDTGLRGRVVNIYVGQDSAGPFSIRGAPHSADGDISIFTPKDVVKCCAGSKPWKLMRFALSNREE